MLNILRILEDLEVKIGLELKTEDFERELTEENIEKVIRYQTQCIKELQAEWALINLATRVYWRKPISNSYLIHELEEANLFEALGFDFSKKGLEKMAYKERRGIMEKKLKVYWDMRNPHLSATKRQCEYLASVARERGHSLSPGTILKFNIFLTDSEVDEVIRKFPEMHDRSDEFLQTKKFVMGLIVGEPQYAKIVLEMIELQKDPFFAKDVKPKKRFLYDNYAEEVKRAVIS